MGTPLYGLLGAVPKGIVLKPFWSEIGYGLCIADISTFTVFF